ncbi:MAG: four helix bundle protein [Prosthecobacter sp.]|nr:four helix bundle protein [Prosthecobacter sp.]MDI1310970.1 four helix bundle protein [Prosthecobacter sp.]
MSYQNLDIWQLAKQSSIEIHTMTLNTLPKFELYEQGSQIRRSSKSVRSTIVEGYGRREYKQDFVLRLTYALASNDETIDHLDTLRETGTLTDETLYASLHENLTHLGKKLNLFIQAVRQGHRSSK